MNIKQLYLDKMIKLNVLRTLRRQKHKVWQKMVFNMHWSSAASPQRAATMAIENERLSLDYDRLGQSIKAIERKW